MFRKRPVFLVSTGVNGIYGGRMVQHKVSKQGGVVRGVWIENGEWWATVSTGFYADNEIDVPILELELAPAVDAVDPHAADTGKPSTRA